MESWRLTGVEGGVNLGAGVEEAEGLDPVPVAPAEICWVSWLAAAPAEICWVSLLAMAAAPAAFAALKR